MSSPISRAGTPSHPLLTGASTSSAPTSPVVAEHSGSFRFDTPGNLPVRTSAPVPPGAEMRQRSAPPRAQAGTVAIPMPPEPTPVQQAQALFDRALGGMAFAPQLSAAAQAEQQTLERDYIAANLPAMVKRLEVFGAGHTPRRSMQAPWAEGRATALFDAVKGGLSSISRSPVRNTFATVLDPARSQLTNKYDAVVIGGAVGGATAYAMDAWTLSAADRRAAAANLAQIKEVDPKLLIPLPSRVQLGVTPAAERGQPDIKTYRRLGEAEHATLVAEATAQQERLGAWQATVGLGGPMLSLLQGGLGGVGNVVRRATVSASSLSNPVVTGAWTAVISGGAGFVAKGLSAVAKLLPMTGQTSADNLVGGRQTLNLFVAKPPHADRPAAGYADLPKIGLETVREGAALALHSFDPRRGPKALASQAYDVFRVVMANTFASAIASGTGPLMASILRDGKLDAPPGEPSNSSANLVQQFAQSGINDPAWNFFKDGMAKGAAYKLGASLDRHRDVKDKTLGELAGGGLRQGREMLQTLVASPQLPAAWAGAVADARAALVAPQPSVPELRTALTALDRLRGGEPNAVPAEIDTLRRDAMTSLLQARDATAQREHLARWRAGTAAPDAAR